jgi:hypothetical protein
MGNGKWKNGNKNKGKKDEEDTKTQACGATEIDRKDVRA